MVAAIEQAFVHRRPHSALVLGQARGAVLSARGAAGLAVHEYPRVGPMGSDILESGMMFTIEPGIYISGWGGVRIEDVVIMENAGVRTLSKARKLERIGG